ncbi:MAG: tetratricopeptide repeat protein [Ignavibacteriales bacterium]|nr:tetratricopeptide repeat protein [Ignavibacteriales bacterium]
MEKGTMQTAFLVIQGLFRYIVVMNNILKIIVFGFLLTGCVSTRTSDQEKRAGDDLVISETVGEEDKERALKHFIDGALYDSKEEHARAILEYQEALRYDRNPAIYYALSKDYSLLGKHALAAQAARDAIKLDSMNIGYRENLAGIYLNASQPDLAIREYEGILAIDSNYAAAWYALARLYQTRKPLKAIEMFERLIDREGESAELLVQVAQLYVALGRFDEAADRLERVLRVEPGTRLVQLQLAETYQRGGKTEKAEKILEEMIEVNEDDLQALAALADLAMEQRKFDKAAALFGRLLKKDSENAEIKLRLGAAYFGRAESDSTLVEKARKLFEEAVEAMPGNWRPYWYLGAIADMQGRDSVSTEYFEQVTRLGGESFDAWWIVATRAFEANEHYKVLEIMEKARRLFPDDFRVYLLLGLSASRLNRNEMAVENLRKALEINPADMNTLSSLALTLDNMKRFEESDSLYERALRIDSSAHIILNNYGYSLAERGLQLDRALKMASQAVSADSANSSYLDTLGWVHFKLGNYPEAEHYIRKAIEAGDASAVVHDHLGDVYYMLKNPEKAMEYWKKAVELDPDNTDLKAKVDRQSP